MGSFAVEDRVIRIHPALDQACVPDYFVAWIVFHEMLHGKHEVKRENGRRRFHTPEFLEEERQFPDYDRACAWEKAEPRSAAAPVGAGRRALGHSFRPSLSARCSQRAARQARAFSSNAASAGALAAEYASKSSRPPRSPPASPPRRPRRPPGARAGSRGARDCRATARPPSSTSARLKARSASACGSRCAPGRRLAEVFVAEGHDPRAAAPRARPRRRRGAEHQVDDRFSGAGRGRRWSRCARTSATRWRGRGGRDRARRGSAL